MDLELLLKLFIAFLPVLAFLAIFSWMDNIDLIPAPLVAALVVVGAGTAGMSYVLNSSLINDFYIDLSFYSRYGAPIVEESLKAIPIIILFHRNRLGYKIDAGVAGFAIGAGFALVENLFFLLQLADANLMTWLVRGFGTAIMHGGTAAIFALISHEMTERQAEDGSAFYSFKLRYFIPGLVAAIIIHGLFNHFTDEPMITLIMTVLLVPLVIFLTFAFNESATGEWLSRDMSAHQQLLDDVRSGRFYETERGLAIKEAVEMSLFQNLTDVLEYIELKIQLVLRSEELILQGRDVGKMEVSDEELEMFVRLTTLEGRIGPITLAAIEPHLGLSRNDVYELNQLRAHLEQLISG